jgi:hypothetical protein
MTGTVIGNIRHVRLAYQPPTNSTFSLVTNQPTALSSQNKSAPAKRTG